MISPGCANDCRSASGSARRAASRVTALQHALAVALLGAGALAQLNACGAGAHCPEGWTEAEGAGACVAPAGYTEAAAARIQTGIYGYALACNRVSDGDDVCTCEVDGIATEGVIELFDPSSATGTRRIEVGSDGTFEARLTPGVRYRMASGAAHPPDGEYVSQGPVELVLGEGETRLVVAVVVVTC